MGLYLRWWKENCILLFLNVGFCHASEYNTQILARRYLSITISISFSLSFPIYIYLSLSVLISISFFYYRIGLSFIELYDILLSVGKDSQVSKIISALRGRQITIRDTDGKAEELPQFNIFYFYMCGQERKNVKNMKVPSPLSFIRFVAKEDMQEYGVQF